jgi:isopenicillin N synthase-like dioxygenase
MWWTRNAYYPAIAPEENQFGISPHSDHSFITLLPLSDVPGLEILRSDGTWLPASPINGGILVNTGEFLNRWSNGRFLATPHRVVAPTRDRYSMAMFFNPNADTVAAPLETCISDENPSAFEPLTMLEYMSWYIDSNYKRESGGRQN